MAQCNVDIDNSQGSVVRYSPDQLLLNTAEALRDVYGHGKNTKQAKTYWIPNSAPCPGTLRDCIDKEVHGCKRRIIGQSFTPAALSSYEPIILAHVRNLCQTLLKATENGWPLVNLDGWSMPQNIASWTRYLTLDVVSDLIYGQSFNLIDKPDLRWIDKPDLRWIIKAIESINESDDSALRFPALLHRNLNSWYNSRRRAAREAENRERIFQMSKEYAAKREEIIKEKLGVRNDLTSTLYLNRDPKTGEKLTMDEVWGEARTMILAGSDTVAKALASTLVHLSNNETAYTRLVDEIRTTFSSLESIHQGPQLISCSYLRSCLDEAMRLNPPQSELQWRTVSPGGAVINGEHIPEGYKVAISLDAIHHNPIYFPDPYTYNPDRFMPKSISAEPTLKKPKFDFFPTSRANTIFPSSPSALSPNSFQGMNFATPTSSREHPAFAPFLLGPRSCVGKPLAYLEMSLALARLVWCMDFRIADSKGNASNDGVQRCMLQFKRREDVDL